MTYKPKVKPYTHQKKALAKCNGAEAFAYLMAMRTGKTKVTIDDFGILEDANEVIDGLVIAPGGVYKTWEKALAEHLSDDLAERIKVFTFSSGMNNGEKRALDHFLNTLDRKRPRMLLMNVEAFSRDGDGRKLLQHYLGQRPKKTFTSIDESTIIKNGSKRTKFINKFGHELSAYRRILSGLATPKSPLDLFYQFQFLDEDILGFNNWYSFRSRVAIMKNMDFGGRSVPVVVNYRPEVIEELKEWIEPYSFRVPFRPKIPSTYSTWEVELTPEQKKAYEEMKEFASTIIGDGHVSATVVIAQLNKLHGILCGHVKDEDGNVREIKENRTQAVLDILSDYEGKAVIWCSYDADIRKVTEALEDEYGQGSVARFWGGNRATREDEEKQFLNNPKCRFIVATQSAGGRGRTWTVADLIIYFSNTDNLEHREQSEQRTMGIDKKKAADFIDIVVPGTVDMKFLHAMRKKIDMATVINGDNYKEWIV